MRISKLILALGLVFTVGTVSAAPLSTPRTPAAKAASPVDPATLLALPQADRTFTVGTLKVQQYGDHGRAVILIPGLESGPWSFAPLIRHLKAGHRVYAVTLAGFDGLPAPDGKTGGLFDRADTSVLDLIRKQALQAPLLIGHSLGGTLALRLAGEHPELMAGVVAVDGLPVFPGTEKLEGKARKAMAAGTAARMKTLSQAQFEAYVDNYMKNVGVRDPALAAAIAGHAKRSDPAAVAAYVEADLAGDFRPGLARAKLPILEIAPWSAADVALMARYGRTLPDAPTKQAMYEKLLATAPDARVQVIADSRHYVMLDQPAAFAGAVDAFIATLPQVAK